MAKNIGRNTIVLKHISRSTGADTDWQDIKEYDP
jgi:hypothetical protein